MRLTNNIISKNYLKSLNKSLTEMNDMNTLIAAKRKYMNFSDDPISALRAMKVRQELTRTDVYIENLHDANDIFSQYESVISNINSIVQDALVQVSQGMTGTSDEKAREAVATSLDGFQKAILAAVNSQFAGKYIFAGDTVGGIDGEPPFSLGDDDKLMYKGIPVASIDKPEDVDGKRYIDIGLGLDIDDDGNVNPNSAWNIAISGLDVIGYGEKNLYDILGKIVEKFKNNDMTDIDKLYGDLQDIANQVRVEYVKVGEKADYVKFFVERLDSNKYNLSVKQTRLEGLDLAEGITAFGDLELAYNACLQIGTKILQPSLLDFLK